MKKNRAPSSDDKVWLNDWWIDIRTVRKLENVFTIDKCVAPSNTLCVEQQYINNNIDNDTSF